MKKKILFLLAIAVAMCLFIVSVSAATTPDPSKGTVTLSDNTVCPLYDTNGNALIWYKSTKNTADGYENYDFIRADSGNGEEDYEGGTVYFKATYAFNSDTNSAFAETKNAVYLYEVSELRIVDKDGNSFSRETIVVFNGKDNDVKVNEATNGAYLGQPVNCIKTVFWANKVIEYIYLNPCVVAFQANAINGCDKLKYVNLEELVNLRQINGSGLANNPLLFLNGACDFSNTLLISVVGSGAMANNRYKELILPKTLINIGDYPFEKNPNLERVVFNSAVKNFSGKNHFYNCTSLKTVEGFENLTLTAIPSGFMQYTAITSIEIPETVVSIGTSAFDSTKLTSLKIPNSCTTIGQNAFSNCTSLKTVILGASCSSLVTYDSFKNCSALEKVYIPATLTSITGNNFNKSASTCVFYYTGSKAQLDALVANTVSNNTQFLSAYNQAKTVAEFEALETVSGLYIVYGYNLCDAFYDGVCSVAQDDENCLTAVSCDRDGCTRVALEAASEHVIGHTVIYADGFLAAGVHNTFCTNANCAQERNEYVLSPMFVADGYSYRIDGTTAGISVRYSINTEAYNLYEKYTSKLSFGIIMANTDHINEDAFMVDGKLNTVNDKGLQISLSTNNYSSLTCTVSGFAKNNATHSALKLLMAAYIYEVDADGNATSDVTYVQKSYVTDDDEATVDTAYAASIERGGITLGAVTIGQVEAYHEYLLSK